MNPNLSSNVAVADNADNADTTSTAASSDVVYDNNPSSNAMMFVQQRGPQQQHMQPAPQMQMQMQPGNAAPFGAGNSYLYSMQAQGGGGTSTDFPSGFSSGTSLDVPANMLSGGISNDVMTNAANFEDNNAAAAAAAASGMPHLPPHIVQQLLSQLRQQGPSALPSIALLTGGLGNNNTNTNNNNWHQIQQQQPMPNGIPLLGTAAAASSLASASPSPAASAASALAAAQRPSGRRGDPRMRESIRYRLAHPNCSLLEALVHGGFAFPPQGSKVPDKLVRDANGITLCQRKNRELCRHETYHRASRSLHVILAYFSVFGHVFRMNFHHTTSIHNIVHACLHTIALHFYL